MAINKTIELTWDGVVYPVLITMREIDQLEEEMNLMVLAQRVSVGDIRYSHAAKLVSILLRSAGAKVTQDDVYFGMFGDDENSVSPSELSLMVTHILNAIFQPPKKKPVAPAKKSRATRGKHSTK